MQATFLIASLSFGAPAPKDPKAAPIVGTWLFLSETRDGATSRVPGEHCWTFTAGGRRGSHDVQSRPSNWISYEVNEKTRPPSLAVNYESNGRERTEHYLFEIDGDTLSLCTNAQGRPTEIMAEKGSKNVIYTLKRVPKKD